MDTQSRPIDGGSALLTDQEACQFLRISPRQLYSWRVLGIIPFIRIGRSIRYRLRDLEAAIESLAVADPSGNRPKPINPRVAGPLPGFRTGRAPDAGSPGSCGDENQAAERIPGA